MKINGIPFEEDIEHFTIETWSDDDDVEELKKLAGLPNLKSASFVDVDLPDEALACLSEATQIDNLCLQATKVSNDGLKYLSKLENLKHLRLKDNAQLTDDAVPFLNALSSLEELQIHETNITGDGLGSLTLPNLSFLVLDRHEKTFEQVERFSNRAVDCEVLVKSRGSFVNGTYSGSGWSSTPST